MRGVIPKDWTRLALPLLAAVLPTFAVVTNNGVVVLVALCAVAVLIARPRLPARTDRGWILAGLLVGWSVASLAWAYDATAASAVMRLPPVVFAGLVLYLEAAAWDHSRRAELLRFALWGWLASMAVIAVIQIDPGGLFLDGLTAWNWPNKVKPASTILVMMAFPVAAYVWRRHSPVWSLALIIACGVVLWPGDAKAAKVALVVGMVIFMAAMLWRRAVAAILAAAVAATVLLAPILAAQPMKYDPRYEDITAPGLHRLIIWDFVAARIAEKPLLGWGFNNSRAIPGGKDKTAMGESLPLHPHNAPLQVWLELGLVGAVLAAAILAGLILAAGRWQSPAAAGALGAFAAVFVVATLSYGIWQSWWLGTLLFILVICRALPGIMASECEPPRSIDPP